MVSSFACTDTDSMLHPCNSSMTANSANMHLYNVFLRIAISFLKIFKPARSVFTDNGAGLALCQIYPAYLWAFIFIFSSNFSISIIISSVHLLISSSECAW